MTVNRGLVRAILAILGLGIGVGAMVWLFRNLDPDRFMATLATAEGHWLFMLAGTVLLEQVVRAWKWRQVLFELKPVSVRRLFGAILAGYGAAILVPLGISPLVRSWLVARLEGLRMASVLVTAAIERFVDGIVFAILVGLVALIAEIPTIEGNLRTGLAAGGSLNLMIFAGLFWLLFKGRDHLASDRAGVGRLVDWFATLAGRRLVGLREAIRDGIVWPRQRGRQVGIVAASVLMKAIAATHFLWAGLAVGITLEMMDYLFLMVVAGFALVLARFIRVPAGFVIGSGFALSVLGVPDEQALAMILFNHVFSVLLMLGIGVAYLLRSGLEIRSLVRTVETMDETR
jgi:hypothetical protein